MCSSAHFLLSDNQNIVSTSLVPITSCIFISMHLLSLSWPTKPLQARYMKEQQLAQLVSITTIKKVSPLIRSIRKMLRIRETAPETLSADSNGHVYCHCRQIRSQSQLVRLRRRSTKQHAAFQSQLTLQEPRSHAQGPEPRLKRLLPDSASKEVV